MRGVAKLELRWLRFVFLRARHVAEKRAAEVLQGIPSQTFDRKPALRGNRLLEESRPQAGSMFIAKPIAKATAGYIHNLHRHNHSCAVLINIKGDTA